MTIEPQEILLTGSLICRGIAIGRPFFFDFVDEDIPEFVVSLEGIELEIVRYQQALAKACEDIRLLQKRLQKESVLEGAAILEAHLQMMQDPLLTTNIEQEIRAICKNAEYVFHNSINQYQKKFESIADPFFRERFKDIQEISRRILGHLRKSNRIGLSNIPHDSIIFASDLSAFDTAEASSACVAAFVTQAGGSTSHAAIVAKAKGIPYVSSVDFEPIQSSRDGTVIVDGRTGKIIINPTSETLVKYKNLRDKLDLHLQKIGQVSGLEAETFDGYKITLSANIETIGELDALLRYGGSGVGLWRTESVFLSCEAFPSEEEQFEVYRQCIEKMNGLPIVIRTFDWGGDKNFIRQLTLKEANPFLGCRAIRFMLKEKELFKTQLRAILRASAYGNVSIMFPMISALSELIEAKAILRDARQALIAQGESVAMHIPVGCMIEVPAAALIIDLLSKECDFLSIGTNDLVQYSLAVDRNNHSLSAMYTPTHPSIIRLIRLIVCESTHHNIPLSICGEIAADPRFTPLLLGLGIRELSVASRYIPIIKNAIRNTSIVAAIQLAEQALTLSSAAEIQELITREYVKNVPEDCFYNC